MKGRKRTRREPTAARRLVDSSEQGKAKLSKARCFVFFSSISRRCPLCIYSPSYNYEVTLSFELSIVRLYHCRNCYIFPSERHISSLILILIPLDLIH